MAIEPSLYNDHADDYEQLVAHEDYEGNLPRALAAIHPLAGARVVDMGAGTGRVTRLLMPHAARITACDVSRGMLTVAADQVRRTQVDLVQADSRALPLPDGCADIAIEGWSFAQIAAWHPDTWQVDVGRAIHEMLRVLRPGGAAILIETQGTGRTQPQPPAGWMVDLYAWFAHEYGFAFTWIRTDYRYPSRADAQRLNEFFFGDEAVAILAASSDAPDGACLVPECTGIWWRAK